jgi:hypothetical protein
LTSFTPSASGIHGPYGTVAVTLASFTSEAQGYHLWGTVAVTLDDFVSSTTGYFGAVGDSATTLDAFIGDASGTA